MPDDLLTTTQAAQILGCSRQHVADLCNSGDLPYTRPGKHRRLRRSDVEALLNPPPRREDERSLWLNYALAAKLVQDPHRTIARAKDRLRELRQIHTDGSVNTWFDRWQDTLDRGPDAVLAVMTERSETAATMRSSSPISGLGLLSPEERSAVLAAFRSHWNSAHRSAA